MGKKTYKQYLAELSEIWLGEKVVFEGCQYEVVDVDYNGNIMINRPTKFNKTTALENWKIKNGIYAG